MTNADAIAMLKNLKNSHGASTGYTSGFDECMDMAIQALEQEPCNTDTCKIVKAYMNEWDKPNRSDAISRQAVNEIINDIRDCISVAGYWAILERMKKLPPVNLQESKYCDRNICVSNEYNGIGCDECEVTKSQEPQEK